MKVINNINRLIRLSKNMYHTTLIILVLKLIFTTYHDEQIGDLTNRDIGFRAEQKMD